MEERRQCIRIDNSIWVSYRVLKNPLISSSRTRNLSEAGLCMPIYQRFDVGVVLGLKIKFLEFDISIRAIGEIVWIKEIHEVNFPFLIGVKFIEIEPSAYDRLRDYIKKYGRAQLGWFEK